MGSKSSALPNQNRRSIWLMLLLIFIILSVLFRYNYLPGFTLFSNDGPLGNLKMNSWKLPDLFFGGWFDLNSIGIRGGAWPCITYILLFILKPVGYSKLYAPISLLLLGLGAFSFFRAMKFASAACIIGGLAAMLNSGFFSVACWGVVAHTLTIAMTLFAMAALTSAQNATSPLQRWLRIALAGFAVGMGVCEGADVGAIFSVYVAIFAMFQAWNSDGPAVPRLTNGALRVAVVAIFAALLAAQAISGLLAYAVTGVAGVKQDEKTKQERWGFATQTSLPKSEALCLLIPGLFGYRMDTPKDMSAFESSYEGGQYWGQVGRPQEADAAYEQWVKNGKQGNPPPFPRFTGGGNYTGVLVVLVALWACFQSFRKEKSIFPLQHRRWIWFWMAAAIGSLLLAFGRYAPFYQLFYALPYASAIRNPTKFIHAVNLSLVVLSGFGLHGLCRQYLEMSASGGSSFTDHLKSWWAKVSGFDRKWVIGCGIALALCAIGWLMYASSRQSLESYIEMVGFPAEMAKLSAGFSIREVGWFILFFALATALMTVVLSGWFGGRRAKLGAMLLGILLVGDLVRANQPWIIVWDYARKYESNAVLDFLREKPYEHRVASLPRWFIAGWFSQSFRINDQLEGAERYFQQVYSIEWAQQTFLYYNIQSLDVVQMPRTPEDINAFELAFQPAPPKSNEDFKRYITDLARLTTRRCELTNTRFLLGTAGWLNFLNGFFDPVQHRFRITQEFNLGPKPGISNPTKLEELTATSSTNGTFAVFEFTGALPRAKLYSNWEISTNADATLKRITSENFDPAKLVLVTEQIPASSAATTNENAGTVEYTSYDPNHIILKANATTSSVLLLNDRYEPNWKVTVDGKPTTLLHCNYIMRGVQLAPGSHTIDYRFAPPVKLFYVSLSGLILGLSLLGVLAVTNRHAEVIEPAPKPKPQTAARK
jgi:hypothetical protein